MMVRALLKDDEVNTGVMAEQGRSWRRARGRAQDEIAARERERRERKREVEEAEKEGSFLTDFLKVKRNLKDSTEVVRETSRFIGEDIESRRDLGVPRIPGTFWPEVIGYLEDLVAITEPSLVALKKSLYGDPDVCDAVVEEDILELLEGDGWFEDEPDESSDGADDDGTPDPDG